MKKTDYKRVMNKDTACGILMLSFSGALYLAIQTQIKVKNTVINSRTVPEFLCAIIAVCSIALIIEGIFSKKAKPIVLNRKTMVDMAKSVLYILMFIIYALLIDKIGYILSTSLLAVGIFLNYRIRLKKQWYLYILSVAIVVAVYFMFKLVLEVELPAMDL